MRRFRPTALLASVVLLCAAPMPGQRLDQLEILPETGRAVQNLSRRGDETVSVDRLQHVMPARAERELDSARRDLERGRLGSAITHMEKVVALDPENDSAINDLGVLYARSGDVAKATAKFLRVLELKPESVRANVQLASLNLSAERAREAEPFARRAVVLAPGRPDARLLLGLSLLRTGQFSDEALACLEKAGAQYPEARLWAAEVLYRRGERLQARRNVESYLAGGFAEYRDIAQNWLKVLPER